MELSLSLTAVVFYLAATVLIAIRTAGYYDTPPVLFRTVWFAALICHGFTLATTALPGGDWNPTFFSTGSTVALLLAATLWISCLSKPLDILGVFVLPVTVLFTLLGAINVTRTVTAMDTGFGMQMHILFSLSAYSILILAAALAVLLNRQTQRLHRGNPTGTSANLPPVDAMESFLFHLLTLGLVLLSLGLITGWIYLDNMFAQHLTHKVAFSIAAWLLLSALFFGHLLFGWRGRKFLKLTLTGTALLVVGFFGSKIVLEFGLQRI